MSNDQPDPKVLKEQLEQFFIEGVQRSCARLGAKMELERILKLFPDLLNELPQVQRIAYAYHARQSRRSKTT
jgi:hypothetical protein